MPALSPKESPKLPDGKMLEQLRGALLSFYDVHKRDLPWRRTKDPYAIWVSEIMLQQTQVDVVAPRWTKFLQLYPDVKALARATEAQVCEAWAGLGYYRRARLLHKAAQTLVTEHAARFPRAASDLQKLPGIGRYTSGAIASIAFGEAAPIVDGNVARVFARIFAIDDAPDTTSGQKLNWALAAAMAVGERPGDFNQALMELGATVCTPRSPKCLVCPARPFCTTQARGEQALYPRASKITAVKPLPMAFAIFSDADGTHLRQRPLEGLWAGLWEPPSIEGDNAAARLGALVGAPLGEPIAEVSHQLSHRDVRAAIYRVESLPKAFVTTLKPWAEPFEAPLSALAKKVLRAAKIEHRKQSSKR